MREWNLLVAGRPARVWIGGAEGEKALLLLHGGWGGATLHWSPVWEQLSARFRVIAPELPGLSAGSPPGPRDVPGFVEWIETVLDTLHVRTAWVAGNSFGASLAWHFASACFERCDGLVLINGAPPVIPVFAKVLFALPGAGPLVKSIMRRLSFNRDTLQLAFADPARAPEELRRVFDTADPPQLTLMAEVIRRGGIAPGPPYVPALILWGTADRLPGISVELARQLQHRLAGSQLELIDAAGHLPQIEQPARVSESIIRFVGSR